MSGLLIATFNYQSGGHRRTGDGFDMNPLKDAFAVLDTPPAMILFCEAKFYRHDQYRGLRLAERALTEQFGAPYFGLLGTLERGPMPPAIFYNQNLLTCLHWPGDDPHDPSVFEDQRNVGRFRSNTTGNEFGAWVAHFDPWHGCQRLYAAKLLGQHGHSSLPFIGGGDLNCSASGPHFPQRDWTTAHPAFRRYKGAHAGFDTEQGGLHGPVRADTAALDFLIGGWNPHTRSRHGGAGYHAITELAWHTTGQPIQPSVPDKPGEGGPDLVDYLLVNDAMRPHVDPASYQVHKPADPLVHVHPDSYHERQAAGRPYPSDHYLITAVINI
ncbi:hypothetical protein [Actinoplanes sp. NPDC049265]|uniref:hypothetical protein n=1 Tax=Actinoplanes sp. NPDC049265 TaxID=3363902 RepID=UPI0037146B0C